MSIPNHLARLALLTTALSSGGCVFEVWAGGGVAQQHGDKASAWSFGASSGFYLDPQKLRTRVGFSKHVDKTFIGGSGAVAETKSSGWSSARVDVVMKSAYKWGEIHPKLLTAVFSWADRAKQVERADQATVMATGDRPWKAFVGYTVDGMRERGHLFTDSLSYSIGPYYSRWDGGADGRVEIVGAEFRITMALSPLGLFAFASGADDGIDEAKHTGGDSSGGGGASPSTDKPTPSPSKTCTTTEDCYPDSTTGKNVCIQRTRCD